MTCGEKIQKLRKGRGYTQEDLADILSVSRQSVSRWESDIAFPETDKLITLAKLFKCSIDYLLNDENDELVEVKAKKPLELKRFLLPIITIILGLLSIGLFFVNSFSVDISTGCINETAKFNYYDVAFFKLESTTYSPFINIMGLFAFISIILTIIASIFLMIFNLKGIGITLNVLNSVASIWILLSIILIRTNAMAVPWILFALYFSLMICSFYIKELSFFKSKKLMVPTISLMCVLTSFVYESVKGEFVNGLAFSNFSGIIGILFLAALLASFISSIITLFKDLVMAKKVMSISNIFILMLSVTYMFYTTAFIFIPLIIIQIVNTGRTNLLGKISFGVLLFEFVNLSYPDLFVVTKYGVVKTYEYTDNISFYNFAFFNTDEMKITASNVFALIVAILFIISSISIIISLHFETKISNQVLNVCNTLIPFIFMCPLIESGNGKDKFFTVFCLLFYIPYIALIICQFVIKPMRSPLINKIIERNRKEVRH